MEPTKIKKRPTSTAPYSPTKPHAQSQLELRNAVKNIKHVLQPPPTFSVCVVPRRTKEFKSEQCSLQDVPLEIIFMICEYLISLKDLLAFTEITKEFALARRQFCTWPKASTTLYLSHVSPFLPLVKNQLLCLVSKRSTDTFPHSCFLFQPSAPAKTQLEDGKSLSLSERYRALVDEIQTTEPVKTPKSEVALQYMSGLCTFVHPQTKHLCLFMAGNSPVNSQRPSMATSILDLETFNPVSGVSKLNLGRDSCAAVFHLGEIYIFGGRVTRAHFPVLAIEKLNIAHNAMEEIGQLAQHRIFPISFSVNSRYIVLFGSFQPKVDIALAQFDTSTYEIFDTVEHTSTLYTTLYINDTVTPKLIPFYNTAAAADASVRQQQFDICRRWTFIYFDACKQRLNIEYPVFATTSSVEFTVHKTVFGLCAESLLLFAR